MNEHFAKHLLGAEYSEEKGRFVSEVLQNAREGHLCLRNSNPPSLPGSIVEEGKTLFPKAPIVWQENRYYIQKNWVYETYLIEQIQRLQKQKKSDFYSAPFFAESLEKEERLTEEQKKVVKHMFDHPFSLICGGPGTGKTYTAGVFVRLLISSIQRSKKKNYRVILTAPTGKAALHLQSSLLSKGSFDSDVTFVSSTLHRLLKLKPGESNLFSKKRIDADLIIVDESSMMDVLMLAHLLESVGDETRLILMGDPNQLPPVEAGSLFAECADHCGVFLKRCMRTEDPSLQKSAEAILKGDTEMFFSSVSISEHFDETLVDKLYEKINPIISSEKMDHTPFLKDTPRVRILNALRQGPFGIDSLNKKIIEKMEKKCSEGAWWAIPIMVTANLPHLNLYNGSVGVLIGQKKKSLQLSEGVAYFPETGDEPLTNPPPYEISFFLSVHKSQGSEFDEVVVLLPEGSEHFGKEALYTAATRAKKSWEVIGKKEIISRLLTKESRRYSGIAERMTAKGL